VKLHITHWRKCKKCRGSGVSIRPGHPPDYVTCSSCAGQGVVSRETQSFEVVEPRLNPRCPVCSWPMRRGERGELSCKSPDRHSAEPIRPVPPFDPVQKAVLVHFGRARLIEKGTK
jgi:hypothetical protein